jgi:hypothetical protein
VAELVRTLGDQERMLCPRSAGLGHDPAHRLAVQFRDAVYDAMTPYRDENGELPEDNAVAQAMDEALHGSRVTNRMWLMRDTVGFLQGRRYTTVETYWWECRLCGFVLPCTAVSHKDH